MKVCVVTGIFHPEPGGPSTYLYSLLGDLIKRGHEVAVITRTRSRLYTTPLTFQDTSSFARKKEKDKSRLVKRSNRKELAEAIIKIISKPEFGRQMGKNF